MIAERFFSLQERTALRALAPEQKLLGFYTYWTCKEAYIKACGDGLSLPLDQFSISMVPNTSTWLVNCHSDPAEAERWSLWSLMVAPGYVGALAVEGHGWQFATWQCL